MLLPKLSEKLGGVFTPTSKTQKFPSKADKVPTYTQTTLPPPSALPVCLLSLPLKPTVGTVGTVHTVNTVGTLRTFRTVQYYEYFQCRNIFVKPTTKININTTQYILFFRQLIQPTSLLSIKQSIGLCVYF